MNISNEQAAAFRTAAETILLALVRIPTDKDTEQSHTARADMVDCLIDPRKWVLDLGYDAAMWAIEQALEATAEHTVNGWEDDAGRIAVEQLCATFGL
jgi:hypothetical protein